MQGGFTVMVYWSLALIFSEFGRDNGGFYPSLHHVGPNLWFLVGSCTWRGSGEADFRFARRR
jgi:hypothetical protein